MVDEIIDTVTVQQPQQSQLIHNVITLCHRDPQYLHILRNILTVDKAYEADPFGWQFNDVSGWSEDQVSILVREEIIRYGYKNDSATHFKLNMDADELKVTLDVIEEKMIATEQQHVLDNIFSERIKALCTRDSHYETLLRSIVQVDKAFENDSFGWQFGDVPQFTGGHLHSLMQNGIIKQTYKSNNYSHFRLAVPREELENILDDIELARLEAEKKHIENEQQKTGNSMIEIVPQYEKLLEDFLEKNLEHIESGLKLYQDEKGIPGRQYYTDIGIIDLLCIDKDKKFVVIEIKKDKGSDMTVGQITRYMGWVKKYLANNNEIRGIIIVREIDEKLEYSASMISSVEIKYYKLSLEFVPKEELGQS